MEELFEKICDLFDKTIKVEMVPEFNEWAKAWMLNPSYPAAGIDSVIVRESVIDPLIKMTEDDNVDTSLHFILTLKDMVSLSNIALAYSMLRHNAEYGLATLYNRENVLKGVVKMEEFLEVRDNALAGDETDETTDNYMQFLNVEPICLQELKHGEVRR